VLTKNALTHLFQIKKVKIVYDTYDLYIDPSIEGNAQSRIIAQLEDIRFNDIPRFEIVEEEKKADINLEYGLGQYTLSSQYLIPVGHIYWIMDSISSDDIIDGKYRVVVSQNSYEDYESFLKTYYPNIEISKSVNLIEDLENSEGEYIALVTPQELTKEMKLLKQDGKYYLDTFDVGISVSLSIISDLDNLPFIVNILEKNLYISQSKLDEDNIAKINMTGVTAITRRLGLTIDQKQDYDYPAKNIGEFLSDADLTHTSNEISFVEGCTSYSGMRFCSKPEYIETLLTSGIDLIGLTGNHNNDYGSKYNTNTINTYIDKGISYYGGGLDATDAAKPFITEIDGTKIAFLGYNYYDSMLNSGAIATDSHAGSNSYSSDKVKENIEDIRDDVDIIIVDYQFQECYSYPQGDVIFPICYKPITNQSKVFRETIDFGADIVVGTQAHQPQTYELYENGVIFYGLGNLFFDQTPWIGTRQGIILTHYFNNGQLIQTKVTPTMYDADLQVEIANEKDSTQLLELLKTARKSL
jgi:poly-gamma-glutamate capsule biosynthesis protein CapA/YwtB (metallophosphatase superfamily)